MESLHPHPLTCMARTYRCNICQGTWSGKRTGYSCLACNFDVCPACYPFVHPHALARVDRMAFVCDLCHRSLVFEKSHYCETCKYDECMRCIQQREQRAAKAATKGTRADKMRRAIAISKTKTEASPEFQAIVSDLAKELPEAEVKSLVLYGCMSSNDAEAFSTIMEIVQEAVKPDDIHNHPKYKSVVKPMLERAGKAIVKDAAKEAADHAAREALNQIPASDVLINHLTHLDATGLFSLFAHVANSNGDPTKFVQGVAKAVVIKSILATVAKGALVLVCVIS